MTELKILNILNLYTLRVCLEMHPFIYPTKKTRRPEHDHNYIRAARIHEYPTRYAQQLHQHIPNKYRHTKTTGSPDMENYTNINSEVWNTLPQKLRENRSLDSFKKELRTYLQEQQDQDTRSYSRNKKWLTDSCWTVSCGLMSFSGRSHIESTYFSIKYVLIIISLSLSL